MVTYRRISWIIIFALIAPVIKAEPNEMVLDFTAPWCGPCQEMKGDLNKLTDEGYLICPVNIDRRQKLKEYCGVTRIPCLVYLKDNKPIRKLVGRHPIKEIRAFLDNRDE